MTSARVRSEYRSTSWPCETQRRAVLVALLSLTAVSIASCDGPERHEGRIGGRSYFEEISDAAGLKFEHENGMSGELYFSEMMGPGGALFDADNDGDLDLYLIQGGPLGEGLRDTDRPGDRLLRNDLGPGADEALQLTLVDVTAAVGLEAHGYGMGVATGDYDNDGWTDVYLANFGGNQLWRNEGVDAGGRLSFRNVTAEAGVEDDRWSTSAAFVDIDGDGWLDLYVVNYVDFRLAANKACTAPSSRRDYCGPNTYRPESDRLFRNVGAAGELRRFVDVSGPSGILGAAGAGMGLVTSDFDLDGDQDVYVANDQTRNLLWVNDGDGAFVDEALLAGAAANLQGRAEASMGVDAGDVDNDGDDDLFMTHLDNETNTLFENQGALLFRDVTATTGVGGPSIGLTGFGATFFDADNDGWLDLAIVNGAVVGIDDQVASGDPLPLRQGNQLLVSTGASGRTPTLVDVSDRAGPLASRDHPSRGLARGDVDNDGDVDLLVINNNGPAQLLINRVGQRQPWIGLSVSDARSGRSLLGARVVLTTTDGDEPSRRVAADGSYCSANDPRVLFGLGSLAPPDRITVRWPTSERPTVMTLPTNRYANLRGLRARE